MRVSRMLFWTLAVAYVISLGIGIVAVNCIHETLTTRRATTQVIVLPGGFIINQTGIQSPPQVIFWNGAR
jgi:hypothetical protein